MYKEPVKKQRSLGKILALSIGIPFIVFILAATAYITNIGTPQWFFDKYIVANYEPSYEIEELVANSGMNDLGEFYFYTGEPSLDSAEQFNINCNELLNEMSNVLGCYNGRIYLFNVTDERISGIKNVTAAHEMLHAAYDRLGVLEKAYVNNLIEKELHNTTNPDILELVELYSSLEPGQEINELHSIFGTQTADLSFELEEYYDRYFSDRAKIVAENEKYDAVFTQLEEQAIEIESKMTNLNEEIDALQNQYLSATSQLSRDVDNFNTRANTMNGFSSEAAFYSERNILIERQNALTAQLDSLNTKIDEYNGYVVDLQALGKDAEELIGNLNSQNEIVN